MSTLTFEAGPPPTHVHSTTEGPRKRRKRAPAAGAANDCFTCSTRKTPCDRRRPYCSPCLDAGQDCAGYKTQLTWGVGVASRGKLRGLSLPVAGTKKVAEPTSPVKKKRTTSTTGSAPIRFAPTPAPESLPINPDPRQSSYSGHQPALSALTTEFQNGRPQYRTRHYSFAGSISNASQSDVLTSPTSSIATSPSSIGWMNSNSYAGQFQYGHSHGPISPVSYSAPAHTGHYFDALPARSESYQQSMDSYPNLISVMNPALQLDNTVSPLHTPSDAYDSNPGYLSSSSMMPHMMSNIRITPVPEEEVEEIYREDPAADALSVSSGQLIFDMSINFSPFSGVNSVGKTPRMQYLIQYYAEVIAPVIVAFDSPTNPFRNQILTLAAKSEPLQHALSALAASNLRQRKESGTLSTGKTLPARRSSQAHLSLTNETVYNAAILPPREQKREETYHKYQAVQSLNAALADVSLRQDDAVLATLLILCMFHICDSGIARFQTQFAGVKKLLQVRRSAQRVEDPSSKWMSRIFTWFDAMAATVNEREGQFDNNSLELLANSDDEWSYETLAGIDSRLIRIMSKLGRLNLLSQGKPVEDNPTIVSRPPTVVTPVSLPESAGVFDGNGWMRVMDGEHFFMNNANISEYDDYRSTPSSSSQFGHAENEVPPTWGTEQFWREWREVRQQLQSWNLDDLLFESAHHPGTAHQHLNDEQRVDVDNISNAFRYSALLYTERLGNPHLPSEDAKIQYWVRQSLHHIKLVRSDVYLLWPLFITGSECVHDEGRNVIRERCLDIQKDSGFVNNASCLALLEKVWTAVPVVGSTPPSNRNNTFIKSENPDFGRGSLQQAHPTFDDAFNSNSAFGQKACKVNGFRFRDVMKAEGNEGEWIVV